MEANTTSTQVQAAPFEEVFAKLKNFKGEFISFDGRSRRGEYWVTALCFALPLVILSCISQVLATATGSVAVYFFVALICGVLNLVMFPVTVRRWHDFGVTGWVAVALLFVGWVPYFGVIAGIAAFVFYCLPGNPGPNAFGPSPLVPGQTGDMKKEPPLPLWIAAGVSVMLTVIINTIFVSRLIDAARELSFAFSY